MVKAAHMVGQMTEGAARMVGQLTEGAAHMVGQLTEGAAYMVGQLTAVYMSRQTEFLADGYVHVYGSHRNNQNLFLNMSYNLLLHSATPLISLTCVVDGSNCFEKSDLHFPF